MGLFQPTTPISAGAAQVFDTGGIISLVEQQKQFEAEQQKYRYQQRKKNEERLMQAKREFDPNGLHVRDIPGFQEKISEYENFLSENHAALAGGTQNIEVWHKKRAMENNIREYMAGSMDFNKKYNAAMNLVLTNPRYNTDENKRILAEISNRPSSEKYDDYSAFQVPELIAQYFLEQEKYIKAVEGIRTTETQARGAEGVLAGDYYTVEGEYVYEKGAARQALSSYWGVTYDDSGQMIEDPTPTSQQKEVRDRYKTMDNFVDKTILAAEKAPADKMLRKPAEPSPRAMTTREKNRPRMVSDFYTQGKTTAYTQTGARGMRKTPVYGDVSISDTDLILHYDSPAAWSTRGTKSIPLVGDLGGFDISSGTYGENLAKHMTKFDVSHMAYMDYAKQPVYAVFEVPDADGNMKRAVKKIERGGLIPKEVKELHRFGSDVNPDQIVAGKDTKNNLRSAGMNMADYTGNDLYAFVQATEDPEAYSIEKPGTEEVFGVFGTSKSQWALKYSDVKHMVDPYLKVEYPEEMKQMLDYGARKKNFDVDNEVDKMMNELFTQ
jgi:hypothetical protein